MGFDDISTIVFDVQQFLAMFGAAIDESPGHTYTSGVSLVPECLLLSLYADEVQRCLVSPRDRSWGRYLYAFSGYTFEATFSRDGQLLARIKHSKIELRDASTGRLRGTSESGGSIRSVDLHPNNRSLVCLSDEKIMQGLDLSNGAWLIQTYGLWSKEDSGGVICGVSLYQRRVAYNTDGTRVVCYCEDLHAILVWSTGSCSPPLCRIPIPQMTKLVTFSLDCEDGHMVALLTPNRAARLTFNEAALLTSDESTVAKVWNINTGEEVKSLRITDDDTRIAAFAKSNTMLVSCNCSHVYVWGIDGDRATLSLAIPCKQWVDALDVTRSGDVIATAAGYECEVLFWDAHTGSLLAVYPGHTERINTLQFSPQGDRLLSTSRDQTCVWDTSKQELSANPPSITHGCSFEDVKFSSDGNYVVASAFRDSRIFVWDGGNGEFLTTLTEHTGPVSALGFSSDGFNLLSFSPEDGVLSWCLSNLEIRSTTLSRSNNVESLKTSRTAFNAGGNLLYTVRWIDRTITSIVYDVSGRDEDGWSDIGVEIFRSRSYYPYFPDLIRFAPNEQPMRNGNVYYSSDSAVVRVWDHASNTVEELSYDEYIHSTWAPPYHIKDHWIISTSTNRRLLWLPWTDAGCGTCTAEHKGLLAIISYGGMFMLLNMSRLEGGFVVM
jgi:WD40 repeat protein